MRRVIFTIYDDFAKEQDQWGTNNYATEAVAEYFDRLLENKETYAKSIGVDFKFYHNTMTDFAIETDLEFTKSNLYKHGIMADLANEYDEIMYVDMDVVFNTNKNVFDELDLSKGIHIQTETEKVTSKDIGSVMFENIGSRSPTLKYHITKDLLSGKDCHVINTGIIVAKSKHIKKIKFIKRLNGIIKKIEKLRREGVGTDNYRFLRMYYYSNNEAIFSYIIEKENIPYVIMENKWHTIIDSTPTTNIPLDLNGIEIVHIINKKFNIFFNDKTKVIYSIYIDIPDERLDNPAGPSDDPVSKSKRTQERLAEYKDRLKQNHVDYAESIGATYLHFERDDRYQEFFNKFPQLSEYNVVNLYKVYLLDQLTKTYDLALYVDLDVVFTSKVDAFKYLKAEHCLCCHANTAETIGIKLWHTSYFKYYNKDFRSPEAKYWNAHAMLSEEDMEGDNLIFNTGIMMASRKVMEKLDYFSDIDDVLDMMKELKEDSIYPPQVQKSFGYDNETIMSFKVKMNNVPVQQLNEKWHFQHSVQKIEGYDIGSMQYKISKSELEFEISKYNIVMVHVISKNFGLLI
jgi:hypothetical protein